MPWRLTIGGQPFEIHPASRLTVDNGEELIDATLAGAVLIYIHRYIVQADVEAGRLTMVFKADEHDADAVFALFAQGKSLSPKVRVVVDHLGSARSPQDADKGWHGP
jgi:LysR family transcriptional regulator for bpeEF and oprC